MTKEEKMKAVGAGLQHICIVTSCHKCVFYNGERREFCEIGDCHGNLPYNDDWDMHTALGLKEPQKKVLPQEVEESIMRHFTEVN